MNTFTNKIASTLIVAAMFAPTFASAQTATSSMATLLAQVKALQEQIVTLQQQQETAVGQLVKSLGQGSRGDDVKILQALLAADADIYPDGQISGYYGKKTAKAVKRFQKLHGIDTTGHVGPLTLKALNARMNEHMSMHMDAAWHNSGTTSSSTSTSHKDKSACMNMAFGHLIAKGWLKKHDKPEITEAMRACLPPGIGGHLGWPTNPGTTTDSAAPTITLTMPASGATVVGTTSLEATATDAVGVVGVTFWVDGSMVGVEDTSAPYALSYNTTALSNATHSFTARARDMAGNTTTSAAVVATVANPIADSTAPVISGVSSSAVATTTATIMWTTNEAATNKVFYIAGTSTINPSTASSTTSAGLSTSHSVVLTGLTASTTYSYVVSTMDASNNIATSSQLMFTTTN